jgi:hypothetical protein
MAASDEQSPDEPLAPLPSWQLFANVATQSELLDEVAQLEVESLGEGVASAPLAVDTTDAETLDQARRSRSGLVESESLAAPVAAAAAAVTRTRGISLPPGHHAGSKQSPPVAPAAAPLMPRPPGFGAASLCRRCPPWRMSSPVSNRTFARLPPLVASINRAVSVASSGRRAALLALFAAQGQQQTVELIERVILDFDDATLRVF